MKFQLDTNVCIRYLNGRSEAIKLELPARRREDIVMCSVVKAELCYGPFKSRNPDKEPGATKEIRGGYHFIAAGRQCG
jgi:tRNA(fMet)-specific endonuclease VapC